MKLQVEELAANGYAPFEQFDHNELLPFVQKHMKRRTFYSLFYNVCNVALVAVAAFFVFVRIDEGLMIFVNRCSYLAIGLTAALLLLPLHEYLHALAYRAMGATKTSYDFNLKKFYFMALADRFVADRREFTVVALAPVTVISALLVIVMCFVPTDFQLMALGTLLAHTAMCSGDFALLSFFASHPDKEIVTYDDVPNRMTYFFAK